MKDSKDMAATPKAAGAKSGAKSQRTPQRALKPKREDVNREKYDAAQGALIARDVQHSGDKSNKKSYVFRDKSNKRASKREDSNAEAMELQRQQRGDELVCT